MIAKVITCYDHGTTFTIQLYCSTTHTCSRLYTMMMVSHLVVNILRAVRESIASLDLPFWLSVWHRSDINCAHTTHTSVYAAPSTKYMCMCTCPDITFIQMGFFWKSVQITKKDVVLGSFLIGTMISVTMMRHATWNLWKTLKIKPWKISEISKTSQKFLIHILDQTYKASNPQRT